MKALTALLSFVGVSSLLTAFTAKLDEILATAAGSRPLLNFNDNNFWCRLDSYIVNEDTGFVTLNLTPVVSTGETRPSQFACSIDVNPETLDSHLQYDGAGRTHSRTGNFTIATAELGAIDNITFYRGRNQTDTWFSPSISRGINLNNVMV